MSTLHTITVRFNGGADRDEAAKDLVLIANLTGAIVTGDWNGTPLEANPNDSQRLVVDRWHSVYNAKARALQQQTAESRLDRIERKLDWFRVAGDPVARETPGWPGDSAKGPE